MRSLAIKRLAARVAVTASRKTGRPVDSRVEDLAHYRGTETEEREHVASADCWCAPDVSYVEGKTAFERLLDQGMEPDVWYLRRLVDAFDLVDKYKDFEGENLREALEEASAIQNWLQAERNYRAKVESWLAAESRWHKTKHLLENNPVYQAAERGWLRMKELAPALDGASNFSDLSPVLQGRYAVFAEGVLSDERDNLDYSHFYECDRDGFLP